MIEYYSLSFAKSRLEKSIVKMGGEFVFINSVEQLVDGYKILSYTLSDEKKTPLWGKLMKHKNTLIDTSDLKLGWVNCSYGKEKEAYFLYREAKRNPWKEGLCFSNVKGLDYEGDDVGNATIIHLLMCKDIYNTLINSYPSIGSIMRSLKNKKEGLLAFSRNFALSPNDDIVFKNFGVVGTVQDRLKLKNKFMYLTELLEEESGE